MVATNVPVSSTPSRLTTVNPVKANATVAVPGRRSTIRYCPEPSVTASRVFSMSTGLDASTVTPGRTAPDESRTTPVMEACANATAGTSRRSANAAKPCRNLSMNQLPSSDVEIRFRCTRSFRHAMEFIPSLQGVRDTLTLKPQVGAARNSTIWIFFGQNSRAYRCMKRIWYLRPLPDRLPPLNGRGS